MREEIKKVKAWKKERDQVITKENILSVMDRMIGQLPSDFKNEDYIFFLTKKAAQLFEAVYSGETYREILINIVQHPFGNGTSILLGRKEDFFIKY